ncbi:hypothetical protein ABPG77_003521 [Micractinium sp. CCAP 211/92]
MCSPWLLFSQWWVTYQTGVTPRKVALIQLCYLPPAPRPGQAGQAAAPEQQHVCLLLHVAHSSIPPHVQSLLCKATAAEDAAGVVAAPSSVGSNAASRRQLLSAPQKWSLAALVSHLLSLRLEKRQGLRRSNWEVRPPLSSMQMHYAATDAWASLRCHEVRLLSSALKGLSA